MITTMCLVNIHHYHIDTKLNNFFSGFTFVKYFFIQTIFTVFIEFITILLLFYGFVPFGHEACGILAPQPGIKPIRPAMEEVLTTELPGEFLELPS